MHTHTYIYIYIYNVYIPWIHRNGRKFSLVLVGSECHGIPTCLGCPGMECAAEGCGGGGGLWIWQHNMVIIW